LVHPQVGASADSALWGTWKGDKPLEDAEKTKVQHYRSGYARAPTPWTFVPLIASTYCHLRPIFLRLLNFLAGYQAERALELEMAGEQPERIHRLLLSRLQGRVSCAVAVATGMRLGSAWADVHSTVTRPHPRRRVLLTDHEADLPLFVQGAEDAPVDNRFPLPRGGPSDDIFGDLGAHPQARARAPGC
jgi:hypothetical protein